jgi:trehalose 6-phosphate synthase
MPVRYMHRTVARSRLPGLYRASRVGLVTPLRDGMNLVAKEYVACRYDDDGALVLSEFAGAADELRQAWLVNPYDLNGMKSALLEACRADPKELRRRMRALRRQVMENDVQRWAGRFLDELGDGHQPTPDPKPPRHF